MLSVYLGFLTEKKIGSVLKTEIAFAVYYRVVLTIQKQYKNKGHCTYKLTVKVEI